MAVSGGQDSLCLAQLLLDLQPHWYWHLGVAHCDHRWRSDSQANADHVAGLAQAWDIPYHLEIATTVPPNEAAARQWRYQVLTTMAHNHHYTQVVTGHTASDRAETLLYNLIRGSGADGLQALTWQRPLGQKIQLVRPLLGITRNQTAAFCRDRDLPVWEDSTNQDCHQARNRIRQELIPYLETHFNPQVQQTLARTAELFQADVADLETRSQALLRTATVPRVGCDRSPRLPGQGPGTSDHSPCLDRRVLQAAPLALQRRVVRQFLHQHLAIKPNFAQVNKMTALITASNRSQTDPFPGGAIAKVDHPWIYLHRPSAAGDFQLKQEDS